jgi:hypothetical protein
MNPISRFDQALRIAAGCSLISYAVFALLLPGTAPHTVDAVRDFAVAQGIASAEHFPSVSLTFAGRYQTLPGYFYLLAVPIFFGANELGVAVSVGMVCLGSVLLLWWQVRRSLGERVANAYLLFAGVFPTTLFLHSVANTALAYACSSGILASLLALNRGEKKWSIPLILLLALIVQLHPSSFPIVLVVVAYASWKRTEWLSQTAVWLACAVFAGALIWAFQFGVVMETKAANVAAEVDSRWVEQSLQGLFNLPRIATIFLTYAQYADSLLDAPQSVVWSVQGLMLIAAASACISIYRRAWLVEPSATLCFAVLLLGGASTLLFLTRWGVWYFDVLQPWLAVFAALGWARSGLNGSQPTMVDRSRRAAPGVNGLVLLPMITAAMNLLPQWWLHLRSLSDGAIVVTANGLFFPIDSRVDAGMPLIAANLRTQLELRRWLAQNPSVCIANLVGPYEWNFRDLTLRSPLALCQKQAKAQSEPQRIYLTVFDGVEGLGDLTATRQTAVAGGWRHGRMAIQPLPPQDVWIDGARKSQSYGSVKAAYSFFSPQVLRDAVRIEVRWKPETDEKLAPHTLHVSLRCIGFPDLSRLRWVASDSANKSLAPYAKLRLLDFIEYVEYRLPIEGASNRVAVELIPAAPLECDFSAYVR